MATRPTNIRQQSALGDVNGEIQEIIEGLKVVKAFTHEEQAKEDFRKLNTAYRDAAQKANFYSIMSSDTPPGHPGQSPEGRTTGRRRRQ